MSIMYLYSKYPKDANCAIAKSKNTIPLLSIICPKKEWTTTKNNPVIVGIMRILNNSLFTFILLHRLIYPRGNSF